MEIEIAPMAGGGYQAKIIGIPNVVGRGISPQDAIATLVCYNGELFGVTKVFKSAYLVSPV